MILKNEKFQKAMEYLFLLGILLYVGYYYIYICHYWKLETNPVQMMGLKKYLYIAIACFAAKIILTIWQYTKYEIIMGVVGAILIFVCWKNSGSIDFIINFLILFAMKNIDSKKAMKTMLIAGIVGVIYGLTMVFLTNPASISVTRDFGRGLVETRYRFSTWHANTTHLLFTTLITCFLYVYYNSCNWLVYGAMLFADYELFQLTRSRAGLISGLIVIIMFFILRYAKILFKFRVIAVLFELLNIGVVIGSLYFGFISSTTSKWYMMIDGMITGRLSVVKRCIQESGYHLFGSNMGGKICGYGVYIQSVPGYVTELGFPRMLLEYGPIVLIGFVILMLFATWQLHKVKNYEGLIFIGVCLLSFAVEAYYPAAYNPLPIMIGVGVFQYVKRGKEENEVATEE